VARPGIEGSGAEEYLIPWALALSPRFVARKLLDLEIHAVGELKCIDRDLLGRLCASSCGVLPMLENNAELSASD
jgi:hypothetical protein